MIGRRALLERIGFLLGAAALPADAMAQALAGGAPGGGQALSPNEVATLRAFCDAVIPATDTGGALEAGVPDVVAGMIARWASPATAGMLRAALAAAGRAMAGDAAGRAARLAAHDAARLAAHDDGYGRLKDLVVAAYYTSEIGATRELRYELVPGVWNPALPLAEDGRAWA